MGGLGGGNGAGGNGSDGVSCGGVGGVGDASRVMRRRCLVRVRLRRMPASERGRVWVFRAWEIPLGVSAARIFSSRSAAVPSQWALGDSARSAATDCTKGCGDGGAVSAARISGNASVGCAWGLCWRARDWATQSSSRAGAKSGSISAWRSSMGRADSMSMAGRSTMRARAARSGEGTKRSVTVRRIGRLIQCWRYSVRPGSR